MLYSVNCQMFSMNVHLMHIDKTKCTPPNTTWHSNTNLYLFRPNLMESEKRTGQLSFFAELSKLKRSAWGQGSALAKITLKNSWPDRPGRTPRALRWRWRRWRRWRGGSTSCAPTVGLPRRTWRKGHCGIRSRAPPLQLSLLLIVARPIEKS